MLLGKRPRPPMRRTTSLTELTVDLSGLEEPPATPGSVTQTAMKERQKVAGQESPARKNQLGTDGFDYPFMAAPVSPRTTHKKNSAHHIETPFLRACNLCKRRLIPGRDIYMYRGDSAFCSLECRQQQMNQDERQEKCSLASKKDAPKTPGPESSPGKGETVAAA